MAKFKLTDKAKFQRYLERNGKRVSRDPAEYERALEEWLAGPECDRSRREPKRMRIRDLKRDEFSL